MTVLVVIVFLALLFDFINGMNDAANSVATVVSTRVLSPRLAVIWAAFFNLAAALGVDASTMSRAIQGLVLVGLVARETSASDRRAVSAGKRGPSAPSRSRAGSRRRAWPGSSPAAGSSCPSSQRPGSPPTKSRPGPASMLFLAPF